MRRGHRIAISAIAATAITAGGGAALVGGPHAQAAKAVGRPAPVTSAGALAEFARLKADVVTNQSQLDLMTRAIVLAQARIQAHAKRQAALALRRAAAHAADSAAHAAHTGQAGEAGRAGQSGQHASPPASTTPVLPGAPVPTNGEDSSTPASAPPTPVAASTTPEPDPTTSAPGDDGGGGHDGDGGGGGGDNHA